MRKLLILSKNADAYRRLIEAARLPDLSIVSTPDRVEAVARGQDSDIVFGDPSAISAVLPQLTALRWVQATWAGVEPLLDPALRRDYVLTNARGVFGQLMSEYVFGYLLAHERLILQKHASQQQGKWDPSPPGTLRQKLFGRGDRLPDEHHGARFKVSSGAPVT